MSMNEFQEQQISVKATLATNNLMEETGPELGLKRYVIYFNNPSMLQKGKKKNLDVQLVSIFH